MSDVGTTKQFGKAQRLVPSQKAQKWYPVDDESQPKKVSTPRADTNAIVGRNGGCGFIWTIAMVAPRQWTRRQMMDWGY